MLIVKRLFMSLNSVLSELEVPAHNSTARFLPKKKQAIHVELEDNYETFRQIKIREMTKQTNLE